MVSDIFAKMADQVPLTPSEKTELQSFIDRTSRAESAVSSWISSPYSPESPYIRTLNGTEAFFDFVPTEGIICLRIEDTSINNNTETTISFSSGTRSSYFQRNSGTILVPHTSNIIGVIGKVEFEENAVGRRAIHVNRYTEAGTLQTGDTLASLSASVEDPTTLPFCMPIYLGENSGTHSFQISVIQTSGGALNMNYISVGIFVLR